MKNVLKIDSLNKIKLITIYLYLNSELFFSSSYI